MAAAAIGAGAWAAPAQAVEPLLTDQWALTDRSLTNMEAAWKVTKGAGVVVAVIDTGVNLDHPDLRGRIWTNPGEKPGNGIDDDGNGYADDVHGLDLVTGPTDNNPDDEEGHGTHVAGILAAGVNGQGVVGVAPESRLMVIRTQDANGRGTMRALAEGIDYAATMGARVINLSLAGTTPDTRLKESIDRAGTAGVVVVAAAGNDGVDADTDPRYPAAFSSGNLVSVAATAPADGRSLSEFSNRGRNTIQLAAPGEAMLSTARNGGWELRSGTSMATPIVAGVAALVTSADPGLSAEAVRARLLSGAARSSLPVTSGYLDGGAAVKGLKSAIGSTGTATKMVLVLAEASQSGKGKKLKTTVRVRIYVSGPRSAISHYELKVGSSKFGNLKTKSASFSTTLKLKGNAVGKTIKVKAVSKSGRQIAVAKQKVQRLQPKKQDLDEGPTAGTT